MTDGVLDRTEFGRLLTAFASASWPTDWSPAPKSRAAIRDYARQHFVPNYDPRSIPGDCLDSDEFNGLLDDYSEAVHRGITGPLLGDKRKAIEHFIQEHLGGRS
jgi:hypothetical protein